MSSRANCLGVCFPSKEKHSPHHFETRNLVMLFFFQAFVQGVMVGNSPNFLIILLKQEVHHLASIFKRVTRKKNTGKIYLSYNMQISPPTYRTPPMPNKIQILRNILPKTNIAPENGWLGNYFHFGKADLTVLYLAQSWWKTWHRFLGKSISLIEQ